MRRLSEVLFLCVAVCLLGTIPALAQGKNTFRTEDYVYSTLKEYEKITGKKITKFNEAPMLKTKVAAGELPPVEERLPEREDIRVIVPVNQPGKYGGTLHKIGTARQEELNTLNSQIVKQNVEFTKVMPDLAKDIEFSKDYKTLTIHLRKGLKWSDGHPFTVDDILFWWEDVILNDELTPVKPKAWMRGGKLAKFEKIDDYTLRIHFAIPSPNVEFKLARFWQAGAQGSFFEPKHYLKKWHIKYNPDADKLAKEEGYDHWWEAYGFHETPWPGGKDVKLPKMGPYKREKVTTTELVYVRNPYYYAVDTEGNQLPYIDKIVCYLITDPQMIKMKAIAGELDFCIDSVLSDYPLYKENEKKGRYRTVLMEDALPTAIAIGFNLNHPDSVKRKIFQDVRFRRAMSLAINREEMNNIVFFGKGKPFQATCHPSCSFYKPEWGEAHPYLRYDPDEANKLLDEVGLDKRDAEGWRLRPDGKRLTIFIQYAYTGDAPATEMLELVKEYWEAVGVKTEIKQVEYSYYFAYVARGEHDVCVWNLDATLEGQLYTWPLHKLLFDGGGVMAIGLKWDQWIDTEGEKGEEPPEEVKQWYKWIDEWLTYPPGTPKYIELAQKIFDWYAENLWEIGLVGMAKRPVILNKNLKNARLEGGLLGWDTDYQESYLPVQWYFEK